jgi:hypothetical protein
MHPEIPDDGEPEEEDGTGGERQYFGIEIGGKKGTVFDRKTPEQIIF